jgi:hypothetical protein
MSWLDDLLTRADAVGRRLADLQFNVAVMFGLGGSAIAPPQEVGRRQCLRGEISPEAGYERALEVLPAGQAPDIGAELATIDERLGETRINALDEAIGIVEERGLLELADAELEHLADVADDAYGRGLRDEELIAILTAAADQVVASRGA